MDGIIRLTNHGENPSKAIQSVINNSDIFKTLHIVCPFYDKNAIPFEGYDDYVHQLTLGKVAINMCTSLDTNNCSKFDGSVAVEIPAFAIIRTGGFNKLGEIVQELDRTNNTTATHFGICPMLVVPEESFTQDFIDAIFGYGLYLITFYIDFIWRIYSRGKLYLHTDIRAARICSMGERKFIPRIGYITKFRDNVQLPISGVDSTLFIPHKSIRGIKFARWNLSLHNKQRIGLWLVTFGLLYYWVAFPWWNYIDMFSYVSKSILNPLTLTLYVLNTLFLYTASTYYMSMPHQFTLCVLHPIYAAVYPLFWVYCMLYKPIPRWNKD